MNRLDIRFENGEVLDAERLNQIVDYINAGGGGGSDVSWTQIKQQGEQIATISINGTQQSVYAPTGGGLSIVRLTQAEYNALIISGEIDEDTLYIIIPPSTIYATFVDYDDTVLETHELNPGDTPVYEGTTPTRTDEYDPTGNPNYPYIEFTFDGWNPQIGPITQDTTFKATYSERRYALTITEKYVREDPNTVSSDKHYIMVTENGYTIQDQIPVIINSDTVVSSSNYITVNSGMATADVQSFSDLTEFEIDSSSPIQITTTFKAVPESQYGPFFLIDETLDKYMGANSTKNSFLLMDTVDSEQEPVIPSDAKYKWAINAQLQIQNPSSGGGTGKVIQYNASTSPKRLAPYAGSQTYSSVLYYYVRVEEKDYLDNRTRGTKKSSKYIPIITLLEHIELTPEDIEREDALENNQR